MNAARLNRFNLAEEITTPGSTVDVVVTEAGIAVNPTRPDLINRMRSFGLKIASIADLRAAASKLAASAPVAEEAEPVVAVVEYRDGSVTDVVRRAIPPRRFFRSSEIRSLKLAAVHRNLILSLQNPPSRAMTSRSLTAR